MLQAIRSSDVWNPTYKRLGIGLPTFSMSLRGSAVRLPDCLKDTTFVVGTAGRNRIVPLLIHSQACTPVHHARHKKYPTVSVLPSKHYLRQLGWLLPVPGFLDTRGSYILPVGSIARTSNHLNPGHSTVGFQTLSTTFIPSFRDNVKVFLDLLILSSVRYPHSTELRILASTVLRFSHFFF